MYLAHWLDKVRTSRIVSLRIQKKPPTGAPREEVRSCMRQRSMSDWGRMKVVMDRLTDGVRQESLWTATFADDAVIFSEREGSRWKKTWRGGRKRNTKPVVSRQNRCA